MKRVLMLHSRLIYAMHTLLGEPDYWTVVQSNRFDAICLKWWDWVYRTHPIDAEATFGPG